VLRRYWVELAWGAFAILNLALMFRLGTAVTVPFHFVWVSLTLVYGFRTWAPRPTLIVCVTVFALSTAAFLDPILAGRLNADELTEVPLMAGMFLAMVWHARRRAAAMEQIRRLADSEHRLREREREFLRDASHSLRTPITVARGYTELIRAAHAGAQAGEDAAVVLGELQKLTLISERLLTLARAEQADFLRRAELDLEVLLTKTARRWTAAAPRRWQVQADDGKLLADPEQLEAALDALIENAVAATEEGGFILLRSHGEDGHAVIEVVDDGSGIRPEHLSQVFDRFWRVDTDSARETRGTGLGLAIVKAIAQAHGGSASVASQVGRGSTFTVRLPGLNTNGDLASTRPSSPHPPAQLAPDGGIGKPEVQQAPPEASTTSA
jgi:signal transduction histidine kinase